MELIEFNMKYMDAAGILIAFSAFLLGIKFPDWDFKLKLKHRNILTHSPFVMIFLMGLYSVDKNSLFRFFIIGFSLGLALHFIFDIFPKGWSGGALLKVPIIGKSFSPMGSISLFILFIIINIVLVVKYTASVMEFIFFLFLGFTSILFNLKKEKKIVRPVLTFCGFYLIVGGLKYKVVFQYVFHGIIVLQEFVQKVL